MNEFVLMFADEAHLNCQLPITLGFLQKHRRPAECRPRTGSPLTVDAFGSGSRIILLWMVPRRFRRRDFHLGKVPVITQRNRHLTRMSGLIPLRSR